MNEDIKNQLSNLQKDFESLEQEMEDMSPQSVEAAIKHVTQTIGLLQQMQQQLANDALQNARVVDDPEQESPHEN